MPFVDTNAISDDAKFYLANGMSRAQYIERDRQWERDRFESRALKGYDAPVPGKTAKARLANYVKWCNETAAEFASLEAQRAKLQDAIDRPAEVKTRRDGLSKTLAKKMLGGEDVSGFDLMRRTTIETEVADAESRAEIAKLALAEINEQIEVKRLQVERLRGRQHEFVTDAMAEHLREKLGNEYRQAIDRLRNVIHQIDAARRASGMAGLHDAISLPALGLLERDAKITGADRSYAEWHKLLAEWGVK
jgi:hypothetical protein